MAVSTPFFDMAPPVLSCLGLQDVDEDEVEETIADDCHFKVIVQLKVPIYTGIGGSSPNANRTRPEIALVHLEDFSRENFDFDVTWFTESFHLLDQIWAKQSVLLYPLLSDLVTGSFQHAIDNVNTDEWIRNKFSLLDEQIRTATAAKLSAVQRL